MKKSVKIGIGIVVVLGGYLAYKKFYLNRNSNLAAGSKLFTDPFGRPKIKSYGIGTDGYVFQQEYMAAKIANPEKTSIEIEEMLKARGIKIVR